MEVPTFASMGGREIFVKIAKELASANIANNDIHASTAKAPAFVLITNEGKPASSAVLLGVVEITFPSIVEPLVIHDTTATVLIVSPISSLTILGPA